MLNATVAPTPLGAPISIVVCPSVICSAILILLILVTETTKGIVRSLLMKTTGSTATIDKKRNTIGRTIIMTAEMIEIAAAVILRKPTMTKIRRMMALVSAKEASTGTGPVSNAK